MKSHAAYLHVSQQRIFAGLFTLILILSGLYIFLVSSSIVNVLVRKEIAQELSGVRGYLSDLESRFIVAKERVTLEYAHTLGFVDVSHKVFVTRQTLFGTGLTVNQ